MSGSMSQAELNRHITNVLNGKASFDDQHFEPVIEILRKSEAGVKTVSMIWKIFAGLTVLGIVLLLVKMNNTSEMALRYSSQAHEQIGMWALGIIVLGFLTVVCLGLNNFAKGRIRKTKEKAVASLRDKLAASDGSQKATYESYLRQLGA